MGPISDSQDLDYRRLYGLRKLGAVLVPLPSYDGEPRSPRTTFTPNDIHRNGEPRSLDGIRTPQFAKQLFRETPIAHGLAQKNRETRNIEE